MFILVHKNVKLTCGRFISDEHLGLVLVFYNDSARFHEARFSVDLHGQRRPRRHRRRFALGHRIAAATGVQNGQVEVVDGDDLEESVVDLVVTLFPVPRPSSA